MRKILMTLLLGLFLISLASACDSWGTFKQNSDIDLIQKCPTCSYVNITSITYPNGTIFLNENMTKNGTNFNYTLPDSSQIGTLLYSTIGDKNSANPPLYEDLCITITATGDETSLGKALIEISLLIFFVLLFMGFYYVVHEADFDKLSNGIYKKYKDKNMVKLVLSAIGYNLMKHPWFIYYLIGFPIMLILTSMAWTYNLTSSLGLMKTIMYIYASGFLLVGVAFLGYVHEWTMDLIERLREMDWGFDK